MCRVVLWSTCAGTSIAMLEHVVALCTVLFALKQQQMLVNDQCCLQDVVTVNENSPLAVSLHTTCLLTNAVKVWYSADGKSFVLPFKGARAAQVASADLL